MTHYRETTGIQTGGDGSRQEGETIEEYYDRVFSDVGDTQPGDEDDNSTTDNVDNTSDSGDTYDDTIYDDELSDSPTDGEEDTTLENRDDPEPNIVVTTVHVNNTPVMPGTQATIDVNTWNKGDGSGSKSFNVSVNGSAVGSVSVSLGAGEKKTKSVSFTVPDAGTLSVKASDSTHTAETKPAVIGADASLTPERPLRGGEATAVVIVKNRSGLPVSRNISLNIQGSQVGSRSISLQPGESKRLEATFTVPDVEQLDGNFGPFSFNVVTAASEEEVREGPGEVQEPTGGGTDGTSPSSEIGGLTGAAEDPVGFARENPGLVGLGLLGGIALASSQMDK